MPPKRRRSRWEQRFYDAWKLCSAAGECDAWNTMESRRVYREWRAAGCPALVERFILRNANRTAGGDK